MPQRHGQGFEPLDGIFQAQDALVKFLKLVSFLRGEDRLFPFQAGGIVPLVVDRLPQLLQG